GGAENFENFGGRDALHTLVDGGTAFVSSDGSGAAEDAERATVGSVAGGIGGAEDGDPGLLQRGGQMERSAIHADDRRGAAGGVNQAGQAGIMGQRRGDVIEGRA